MVIPHYQDHARLRTCLAALAPQLAAHPGTDCVVVDNASPTDPAPLVAEFPGVRLVREIQKGAAVARNRGAAETTAPGLAFLDCDCVPAADWLATAHRLTRTCGAAGPEGAADATRTTGPGGGARRTDSPTAADAPPATGRSIAPGSTVGGGSTAGDSSTAGGAGGAAVDIVGGRIDTFEETPPPRSGAEAFETVFAFHQRAYIETKGFSVTANLLTTRVVFDDVGPLRPGLSEDMEWCFRATAKGYAIAYADDLRVAHPTRSDWPALVKKWRRTTDEMFHLSGTGPAARVTWALRAGAVLASIPVHLPRLLRDGRLAGGERLRGAVTLTRLRALRAAWMLRQAATGR